MARRKYKNVSPDIIAETALNNLIAKISDMQSNYARAMSEFAVDPSAQARYKTGIINWTNIMRSAEIRTAISQAIQRAKDELRRRLGVTVRPVVTVPAR